MMLGERTVEVLREAVPGDWSGGQYVPGERDRFVITGALFPANPREVELLEEAARTRARWSLYCEPDQEELRTTDLVVGAGADRVLYLDQEYVIFQVGDYTTHDTGIPHRAYLLLEIGRDEDRDEEVNGDL